MMQYLYFMFEVLKERPRPKRVYPYRSHLMMQYLCFMFEVLKERPRPKRVYPYRTCLMLQYQCFVAVFEVLKGEAQTKEGVPIQVTSYDAISLLYV